MLATLTPGEYSWDNIDTDRGVPVGFGGQWGYYTDTNDPLTDPAGPSGMELILLGQRYYDPYTGRFLTRDPIGYDGGINVYAYTGNNPVNAIDPSGENALDWLKGGVEAVWNLNLQLEKSTLLAPVQAYMMLSGKDTRWGEIEKPKIHNPDEYGGFDTIDGFLASGGIGGDAIPAFEGEVSTSARSLGEVMATAERAGPRGHRVLAKLYDPKGALVWRGDFYSKGAMTEEIKAIPWPNRMWYVHTEKQAMRACPIQKPGYTLVMTGYRAPCNARTGGGSNSCQAHMTKTMAETGLSIIYRWRQGGRSRTWP